MYREDLISEYTLRAVDRNGDGKTTYDNLPSIHWYYTGLTTPDGYYNFEPEPSARDTTILLSDLSKINLVSASFIEHGSGALKFQNVLTVSVNPREFFFGAETEMEKIGFQTIDVKYEWITSKQQSMDNALGYVNTIILQASPQILAAELDNNVIVADGSGGVTGLPVRTKVFEGFEQFYYRFEGSSANDTYHARLWEDNFRGNLIADGGGGNDTITGSDRTDFIYGGSGDDVLMPFYNSTYAFGQKTFHDNDLLVGDTLDGGPGNDTVYGELGGTMIGGDGIDRLVWSFRTTPQEMDIKLASQQNQLMEIGQSTKISGFEVFQIDFLVGNSTAGSNLTIDARDFKPDLSGAPGNTSMITAGAFNPAAPENDTLFLNDNSSMEIGFRGFEHVSMDFSKAASAVDVESDGANFRIKGLLAFAGTEDESTTSAAMTGCGYNIVGTDWADFYHGSLTADTIDAGDGNDTLTGGFGDDILSGGGGDDKISGDAGADTMTGGAGDDTFTVDDAGDVILENKGGGNDTVTTSVSYALKAGQEVEVVNFASVTLSTPLSLTGNNLANTLVGNGGANVLNGLSGNDILDGRSGADTLDGGAGKDTASYANTVWSGVTASLAKPSLNTSDALGDIYISIENLTGSSLYSDKLYGNAGANVLNGGGGDDTLSGAAGNDRLLGDTGNDVMMGGAGKDTLLGGAGDDILTGGGGADTFGFATGYGQDTIADFKHGDGIDLDDWKAIHNFRQLKNHAANHGSDVWITAGSDILVIEHVHKANLQAGDFEF